MTLNLDSWLAYLLSCATWLVEEEPPGSLLNRNPLLLLQLLRIFELTYPRLFDGNVSWGNFNTLEFCSCKNGELLVTVGDILYLLYQLATSQMSDRLLQLIALPLNLVA